MRRCLDLLRWTMVLAIAVGAVWCAGCGRVQQRADARLPIPLRDGEFRELNPQQFLDAYEAQPGRRKSAPGSIDVDD
jgi:hypothetical protein